MVFVVLSGLPLDVDPADLAQKINSYFGENKEIGTFRVNIDDSDIRKPKAVLKFEQGFDAMEAQRLLDNFKYIDPDNRRIYNIKAIVPANDQPYKLLFREEISDIADVIIAEKKKRKKEKEAKKRRHSPIDKNVLAGQSGHLGKSLETTDIEKLHKKPRKMEKVERLSQSDHSASESEYKNKKQRDYTIYGESSGVSKRSRSPEDHNPKKKYRKEQSLERKSESSRVSTSTIRSRSRSSSRPFEDLRHKVEARRSSVRTRERYYESYYDYGRGHVESPRKRITSQSEGSSWSDKEKRSSIESTDSEYSNCTPITSLLRKGKQLLLLEPSHYLTENDMEFKEAVAHIIHTCTVATDTERLLEEDKKLILDNYTATVVSRLKQLKFTNLMSIQDIVLDYKLVYKTADDKLLINNMIKELQALGKGTLLPEIKEERLNQAIEEAFDTTNIDELIKDVKPEIKTEKRLEYEYEDQETTEVINIVVNLVPIEKRELPFETDPDKVADIKVLVKELKNTKPTKFFRPIRSLLNEMKLFIYKNVKVVPSEVILNRMVEVLEKILARMLGPIKTRVKSKDVCNLFRNAFPYKEDREFVDMIIKWILDGEFDKGAVDGLIVEKMPKIEKNIITDEDNSTKEHVLLTPIKMEPENTDTTPTIPVPLKMEITDNEDNNQTEQSVTTNLEQQTKDAQLEQEKQTNLVLEKIDEDIIIKKEPVELIIIDDDDLVANKESGNDIIPVPIEIKSEAMNICESEDEGALSDDSTTTLVIETKPFIGINPAIEVATQNIEQGAFGEPIPIPVKSELLCEPSESSEILGEPGEILGEPGEIFDNPGETIDDIRQYIKSEGN